MAVRAEEIGGRGAAVDIDRDRLLVVRHQDGDDAAFEELYRRYHGRLVTYCQRRVGDRHVAEELAQEAFVRALRAMPRFAGERRFYPWMTVIASRLCIDHHRRAARVEPAAEVDPGAVEADHDDLWTAVDRHHLRAAVDRLAPRHREILYLREQQGWSYQRIAAHLDVPLTTVEALLHRARKALRREYLAVAGDAGGRPVAAGGLAALLGRCKGWLAGVGPERLVPALGTAAVGVAAAGLAVGPLTGAAVEHDLDLRAPTANTVADVTPAPTSATPALREVIAPDPGGVGGGSATGPTPTAPPARRTIPAPPPPVASAGPVNVYQGPAAADYADATNADEPVHVTLGELADIGADPAALAVFVVTQLLPPSEDPSP